MIGTRIHVGDAYQTPRILLSIPTTGWIHKTIAQWLLQVIAIEQVSHRCSFDVIMPTHVPFENNLHHIVQDVIDKDYDFWISIDQDNPPMKNVLDVVFLDKDIIGCPTPVWHFADDKPGERPIYWNGYDYFEPEDGYKEHDEKEGLQSVDAVGTGCIIIACRVLMHRDMQKGCFSRILNSNGTVYKGNDLAFCERARAAGFSIWCHYNYPCRHVVELELMESVKAMQGLIENAS